MSCYRETQLQVLYEKLKKSSDLCQIQVSHKDNKISDKLRSMGNKFYLDELYVNAIDKYNESLCFAQLDGDLFNLSVAYANRADALFKMDLPRECMKSIELAEASKYPEHLRTRLTLMASRCQDRIKFGVQERSKYRLKLSYPAQDRIPGTAKCLTLKTSEEFGRYLVANHDLHVGDVVMIERPFIVCLRPNMRYKRCTHCMAGDQRHALIPCPTCTNAMYCSEVCLKESWLVYHRFECKISEHLNDSEEFLAMALRALLVGVSIYGGLENCQSYLAENEALDINAFDLDFNPEKRDRRLEFLVLHKMHFEDSQMSISDRNYWMRRAAELTHLLVQAEVFPEPAPSPALVAFVLNSLYRYTITSILNCYETSTNLPDKTGNKDFITVSQHLTMAMINHSCAPNVQRIQQAGHQVLMVVRPIPKGAQLFDNYGEFYTATGKKERQDHLYRQYGFRCSCEACTENFPVAKKLKHKKGLDSVDLVTQENPSLEAKLNRADKLAEFMQKYDHNYPCAQLQEADTELYEIYTTLVEHDVWEDKFKVFN